MTTFTMRHDIDCAPDRFWQLFFDNQLQKEIFEDLAFPKWEVVETKETDKEIVRIVNAIPKLDAPAAVAKLLGSGFGYREEGRFDRAEKVFRFVVKPTTLANKLTNEGSVRVESKGEGQCTRVVDVRIEAKILGVGGMIEKMTEKGFRDGWGRSAEMFNTYLKKAAG